MLNEFVARFSDVHVFVVGDVILDIYAKGVVNRISPEADVPIFLKSGDTYVLGGAANVAANVASLSANAILCGRIGNDEHGRILEDLLKTSGIENCLLKSGCLPTTSKLRIVGEHQQLLRIDTESIEDLDTHGINKAIEEFKKFMLKSGKKALILSDYAKGTLPKQLVESLIKLAGAAKIPVVTDPKNNDLSRYSGSDVIKPNLKEGRTATGVGSKANVSFEQEIENICRTIAEQSGCKSVVLSLSQNGVAVLEDSFGEIIRLPSQVIQVSDVSGAGDTMVACLGVCKALGIGVREASEIGNIAAGIACAKFGTAPVSSFELISKLEDQSGASKIKKLKKLSELLTVVKNLKALGQKIVFTNGCFDLLHSGHIETIEYAKSLGDFLILGLNSDSSITKLKGPSRPIHAEIDRARVLSSLSAIDAVVVFEDSTPHDIIKCIRPDIVVKGGDYLPKEVVGYDLVSSWGGQIKICPLVPGRSSSLILERLK